MSTEDNLTSHWQTETTIVATSLLTDMEITPSPTRNILDNFIAKAYEERHFGYREGAIDRANA